MTTFCSWSCNINVNAEQTRDNTAKNTGEASSGGSGGEGGDSGEEPKQGMVEKLKGKIRQLRISSSL